MRACLYLRVSTPSQAEEDRASLGEQEQRCRQHCEAKGYDVAAVYTDVGSGASRRRPQFQEMLKGARGGQFNVIVAWKADRLARGISPCAALYEALESTTIGIETVAEPFDRTTFEIRAVLGRMELENIAQRTQMGREAAVKAGHHHAKPPFGYDYDPAARRWVVNEFEARRVQQIFHWYIDGVSTAEIARRLNAEGVPTKYRSRLGWTAATVSKMMGPGAESYCGAAYFNKKQGRTYKAKDRERWIAMKEIPPLISRETLEAARTRRATNKRFSPRNTQAIYLTQHILFCSECSYHFQIHSGVGQPRLMCWGMVRYPHLHHCRKPKTLYERPQGERLWQAVAGVLGSEAGLEAAIRSRVKHVATEREAMEQRLKELEKRRGDLKLEQDRVITWARKGSISEDQLNNQLRAIQAEEEQYATEQARLWADLKLQGDAEAIYQQARQLIPMLRERLNGGLSDKGKQEIIRLLVRRALLDGEGNMTVEFSIPEPVMSFDFSTGSHTRVRQ